MEGTKSISIATRRWLVREIESGRMSVGDAIERIELHSKDPEALLRFWRKKYAPEIPGTLPVMLEKEKQKRPTAVLLLRRAVHAQGDASKGRQSIAI